MYISSLFVIALALAGLGVSGLWYDIGWAGNFTVNHWGRFRVRTGNVQVAYAKTSEVQFPQRIISVMRGDFGSLYFRTGSNGRWRWVAVSVPLWMLVALLFVEPAWAYYRGHYVKKRRAKRHLCTSCGYELRGIESDRCPECGTSINEPGPAPPPQR